MDSHPPLSQRIKRARFYNLPAPELAGQFAGTNLPMISLIDELAPLEHDLLKKVVPALANAELKSVTWESAGMEVFVPRWRKIIASHLPFLSTKTLSELPGLVKEPREISNLVANPPGMLLNQGQRDAKALEVLYCAMALCLVDHGWTLLAQPGILYLECAGDKFDPGGPISAMKSGKLAAQDWESDCIKRGISKWPLASLANRLDEIPTSDASNLEIAPLPAGS
jgi:hypothetical protein